MIVDSEVKEELGGREEEIIRRHRKLWGWCVYGADCSGGLYTMSKLSRLNAWHMGCFWESVMP